MEKLFSHTAVDVSAHANSLYSSGNPSRNGYNTCIALLNIGESHRTCLSCYGHGGATAAHGGACVVHRGQGRMLNQRVWGTEVPSGAQEGAKVGVWEKGGDGHY
jgi:DnaJ-class molecular chaperone